MGRRGHAHPPGDTVTVKLRPVRRKDTRGMGLSAYLRDPDGDLIELISRGGER